MDYRDERDALRARVEGLEGALATAEAELSRMRATEVALEASKREVQWLRGELARTQPAGRPQKGRGPGLIIGAGLAVMAVAFGAAMVLRARPHAPVVIEVPQSPKPWAEPPEPPEPAPKPVAAPPRPAPPKPAAVRRQYAEWSATIAAAQGSAPPPGTACKILAELTGDGAQIGVGEVEVSCGAKFLYRSTDTFSGMSNNGSDATEEPGKSAGTLRHTLVVTDQGTRTGRSQISLDTAQRTGTIWSDNVPLFRATLRMEPWSLERTGDPLVDAENRRERLGETVVRTGTIAKIEGSPPAPAGAACTVDVSPAQSGDNNCRIRVRCGNALLYGEGQSGYNQCPIKEGRVGRVKDDRTSATDGDPGLDMDLSENTVIVSEIDGDPSWKVTVALARATH
jgi:hypothetical protein